MSQRPACMRGQIKVFFDVHAPPHVRGECLLHRLHMYREGCICTENFICCPGLLVLVQHAFTLCQLVPRTDRKGAPSLHPCYEASGVLLLLTFVSRVTGKREEGAAEGEGNENWHVPGRLVLHEQSP